MRAAAAAATLKIMHSRPEPVVADVAEPDTVQEEEMRGHSVPRQALAPKQLPTPSAAKALRTEESADTSPMDNSSGGGSDWDEDEAADIETLEAKYAQQRASRAAAAINDKDDESASHMDVSSESVADGNARDELQPAPEKATPPHRRRRTRAAAAAADLKMRSTVANSRSLARSAKVLQRRTAKEESREAVDDKMAEEAAEDDSDAALWDITGSRLEVKRVCGRVEGKLGVFSVLLVGEC